MFNGLDVVVCILINFTLIVQEQNPLIYGVK